MNKVLAILLFVLSLLAGCGLLIDSASNEQIALCVQTCKGINAKMYTGNHVYSHDGSTTCSCIRFYKINKEANNTEEVSQ